MGPLKLFISHSSRLDDPKISDDQVQNPNLKLLLEVIAAIKQEYGNKVEILVDKDPQGLPVGQDWEKRLNEWLAECHVAIILFSKRAIENSNWVQKEAAILSWRRELDKDFKLIPICIEGQTTPDDLDTGIFATLHIGKSQGIRNAANCQDIMTALRDSKALEAQSWQTPFDKLEQVITTLLENNATANTLEIAWQELNVNEKPDFYPARGDKFAHALTRYLFRNGKDCLTSFQAVVNKIRPKVKKDNSLEMLEYIRALWVDTKAASCIPSARSRNNFLAMNGKYLVNYTCQRYAERAWPMDNSYQLVFTTQSEEPKLIEEIQARFNKGGDYSPEDCDSRINNNSRQIIIYLNAIEQNGCGVFDDPILRPKLKQKYPKVIFILGTGEKLPANKADDITFIEPELELSLEKSSKQAEDDTTDFLEDYYGH
jgi:hypothetical protein